jgi:quinoprotein glucose dehydrogenase
MYVLAQSNSVVALDAASGKELWVHLNMGAVGQRGMNYWENRDRSDRRLFYINGGFLKGHRRPYGKTVNSFGDNGRTDLRNGLDRDPGRALQTSNPGRIFEDIIITPLPAGGASYDSTPADIHIQYCHGQTSLDFPRGSAAGRIWSRDVASGGLEDRWRRSQLERNDHR